MNLGNIGVMGMAAAAGLLVAALFFGKDRKVQKMKEELEKLMVIANHVRDPNELAIVTAKASVLSAQLLQEVAEQLKKMAADGRRESTAEAIFREESSNAFGGALLEVKRLLKKIAGEGDEPAKTAEEPAPVGEPTDNEPSPNF